MRSAPDRLLAFSAGAVLAVMIELNSVLAAHTGALFASWFAHGLGAAVALLLVAAATLVRPQPCQRTGGRAPLWAYLGGVPGAFTVVLAATAVNNGLALAGTLALMLAGQMAFGLVADSLGWFGLARRRLEARDVLAALAIFLGSAMLLFGRSMP